MSHAPLLHGLTLHVWDLSRSACYPPPPRPAPKYIHLPWRENHPLTHTVIPLLVHTHVRLTPRESTSKKKKINNLIHVCFSLPLYGALVFQSVLTKGLRPLDPCPAGGRCRGRPRVHESATSLIHQQLRLLPSPSFAN